MGDVLKVKKQLQINSCIVWCNLACAKSYFQHLLEAQQGKKTNKQNIIKHSMDELQEQQNQQQCDGEEHSADMLTTPAPKKQKQSATASPSTSPAAVQHQKPAAQKPKFVPPRKSNDSATPQAAAKVCLCCFVLTYFYAFDTFKFYNSYYCCY